MQVLPELLDHPKYLLLKRMLGAVALECLLRVWGHCETGQRREWWPGATADYVEAVARWNGRRGEFYQALVECRLVVTEGDGAGIRVKDWDHWNSRTIASWRNGKGGGRPRSNPRVTHGKPTGNPQVTHGVTQELTGFGEVSPAPSPAFPPPSITPPLSSPTSPPSMHTHTHAQAREGMEGNGTDAGGSVEFHVPTVAEVQGYGMGAPGIPADYCGYFHARQEEAHAWVTGLGRLVKWRERLVRWWQADREAWLAGRHPAQRGVAGGSEKPGGGRNGAVTEVGWRMNLEGRIKALGAELERHPGNKKNAPAGVEGKARLAYLALKAEREGLERELAGGFDPKMTQRNADGK